MTRWNRNVSLIWELVLSSYWLSIWHISYVFQISRRWFEPWCSGLGFMTNVDHGTLPIFWLYHPAYFQYSDFNILSLSSFQLSIHPTCCQLKASIYERWPVPRLWTIMSAMMVTAVMMLSTMTMVMMERTTCSTANGTQCPINGKGRELIMVMVVLWWCWVWSGSGYHEIRIVIFTNRDGFDINMIETSNKWN